MISKTFNPECGVLWFLSKIIQNGSSSAETYLTQHLDAPMCRFQQYCRLANIFGTYMVNMFDELISAAPLSCMEGMYSTDSGTVCNIESQKIAQKKKSTKTQVMI